ncbi:MAG: hypothetical protein ACI87T_003297, partial [Planctomycetota bacterium]
MRERCANPRAGGTAAPAARGKRRRGRKRKRAA